MAVINKNGTFMALPMAIKRGNPYAIDTTSVWYDRTALEEYAKSGATAYVGQVVTLVDEEQSTAKTYVIANAAGDLQEVGSSAVVDNATVQLSEDGQIALKNWGVQYYQWISGAGEEEGRYELVQVDGEHPWKAGLTPRSATASEGGQIVLDWYEPSDVTVEDVNTGLAAANSEIAGLKTRMDTAEGTIATHTTQISGKLDLTGGTMTGALTLQDNSEAASKKYVAEQIGSAGLLKREIVAVLPEVDAADENTIYMIKDDTATGDDKYKEYMLIDGTITQIGDTSVDLTGYATKAEVTSQLGAHTGNTDIHVTAAKKAEWDAKVNAVPGSSLVEDTLITKLRGLQDIKTIGANLTLSPEGELSASAEPYELPTASTSTLGGVKIDGVTIKIADGTISVPAATGDAAGLLSASDFTKIQNIEAGAQANKIESIKIGDAALPIQEKAVTIPTATAEQLGLVKSSADNDAVSIDSEGKMTVNKISAMKLYVAEDDELILDGGKA